MIGETEPVPFIEAFVDERLPAADPQALTFALIKVTNDPALRTALESRDGFKPIETKELEVAKKSK